MASSGRPPCPCCVQRAEHVLATARRRIAAALAAAGLAGLAVLCWSAAGPGGGPACRVILVAAATIVAAAFIVLPLAARSHRQRGPAFADWRTWPPGYDPWAGRKVSVSGRSKLVKKAACGNVPSAKVKP